MCVCLCPHAEPDLRMEPGQAHHFFLQILSGVVSERVHTNTHSHTDSVVLANMYSKTSLIQAARDQGVPVSKKCPDLP